MAIAVAELNFELEKIEFIGLWENKIGGFLLHIYLAKTKKLMFARYHKTKYSVLVEQGPTEVNLKELNLYKTDSIIFQEKYYIKKHQKAFLVGPTFPGTISDNYLVATEYLSKHYAFFNQRQMNWKEYIRNYGWYSKYLSEQGLRDAIVFMIRMIGDPQIGLSENADPEQSKWKEYPVLHFTDIMRSMRQYTAACVLKKRYLTDKKLTDDKLKDQGSEIEWGLLNRKNKIGYCQFQKMQGNIKDALDAMIQFFNQHKVKGLVIDLRFSKGSDAFTAIEVANRLTDQRRLAFGTEIYSKNYRGGRHLYFLNPIKNQINIWNLNVPIILLTSEYTSGSAEIFTQCIMNLSNCTVIGEKTAGSLSKCIQKTLPNGWVLSIPNEVRTGVNGVCFEVNGIPPHLQASLPTQHKDEGIELALLEIGRAVGKDMDIDDGQEVEIDKKQEVDIAEEYERERWRLFLDSFKESVESGEAKETKEKKDTKDTVEFFHNSIDSIMDPVENIMQPLESNLYIENVKPPKEIVRQSLENLSQAIGSVKQSLEKINQLSSSHSNQYLPSFVSKKPLICAVGTLLGVGIAISSIKWRR